MDEIIFYRGAKPNQADHTFDNYTGRLQASIDVEVLTDTANVSQVDMVLGSFFDLDAQKRNRSADYADKVYRNGRNPEFDTYAQEAGDEIERIFNQTLPGSD
jgi:hypothetical protein